MQEKAISENRQFEGVQSSVLRFLQGMVMGIAQIIPGVSGGTLALVMGIYERFLGLLNSIGGWLTSWRSLLSRTPTKGWQQQKAALLRIDWLFAVLLAAGMGSAILLSSGLIEKALLHYKAQTYGFFCGLILVSVIVPWQKLERRGRFELLAGVVGFVLLFWLGSLSEGNGLQSPSPLLFFLGGAVSISAMILPGLSGSFVLLVMGLYQPVIAMINAVKGGDLNSQLLLSLGLFAAGMVIGLFSFAKVLEWLLKRCHSMTMAFLIGLMFGSLRKIFPFEAAQSTAAVLQVFAWIVAGGGLVAVIYYVSNRTAKKQLEKGEKS